MSRKCAFTGKGISAGRQYSIRGIAKIRKGIGLKTTSKTKRWFRPNIQKKRIWSSTANSMVTVLTSTKALRSVVREGGVSIEHLIKKHFS